jgi:hypothetical protein
MNKGLIWTDGQTLKTYDELATAIKGVNYFINGEVKKLSSK